MTKTVLIGLDGATFTVLSPFIDGSAPEGVVMPFLAGMVENGFSATLASTAHPLTPPAWTTVATGRTPGAHGIYDFVRFEDMGDDMYFTLYDARDIRVDTLWEIASQQGSTVASLNFPMMAPPPAVNGTLIPGFVSWKHLRRNMYPSTLFDRVAAIPGFDPKELSWDFEREGQIGELMEDGELLRWVENHLPRDRQWYNIASHLMQADNPDLMALMLDGTDKIQHQAWHILDPEIWNPETASPEARAVREVVVQYFRDADDYIARLAQAAGPEAHVIIVSDHGFTGSSFVVRINAYLEELGHLKWRPADDSAAGKRRDMANFANLDWTDTQAFCPTPSSNGIVIRRQSEKCPNGVPADHYEAFRDRLIEDLLQLQDPETGTRVITNVLKREDAFPGAAMGEAPDLTLELVDHGFVSVRNRKPSVVTRPVPFGTHHPDGIFIMSGPGVTATRGRAMSIVDTTAIMAHSMGLEVPAEFEGKIPATLYDPDWRAENPVKKAKPVTAPAAAKPRPAEEASAAQKEEMLAQLRLLGYIED
ncbi:alkaline phosphatase family protein [Shimia sp.]|uniref:alkaline phosphatase family protein n=1 Tax=Shimia sp. TaxID=1954381 RepID=UPI0035668F54